jgi:putative nucleotidyltransferase with HDIG domain
VQILELCAERHIPVGEGAAGRRPPPRLLSRTLTVTFATVALILGAVFLVLTLDLRRRARNEVADGLEGSRRAVEVVDMRRAAELDVLARALAENPTLAAALQKCRNDMGSFSRAEIGLSLGWLERQLDGIAEVLRADVAVLLAADGIALVTAGSHDAGWLLTAHQAKALAGGGLVPSERFVHVSGAPYRIRSVPLTVHGRLVARLCVADRLDERYASRLSELTRAETVVTSNRVVTASSLEDQKAAALTFAWTADVIGNGQDEIDLLGERYVIRSLLGADGTAVYGLAPLGARMSKSTASAYRALSLVAGGSLLLAWLGSYILAHRLSAPINRISSALTTAVDSKALQMRLAPDSSSRELDAMTQAFNRLMVSLARSEYETDAAYLGAIRALVMALDARDPYTAGHSARVSDLSVAIARRVRLDHVAIEVIRLGALLHDIGKIGVDDAVLNKTGPLTAAEQAGVRVHPILGVRILEPVAFLAAHLPIVELHHERPDGQGYPHGLSGDAIPLEARIVHVADAYDAMTSARPYRPALAPRDAIVEIVRHRGTQFDAAIVDAFLDVVRQEGTAPLEALAGSAADVA